MSRTLTIEEDNLSVALGEGTPPLSGGGARSAPLICRDSGIHRWTSPWKWHRCAELLDDTLGADAKGLSCNEVANTIFPSLALEPAS